MINQILASAMVLGAMAQSSIISTPEKYVKRNLEYSQYANDENKYYILQWDISNFGSNLTYNTFIQNIEVGSNGENYALTDFYFGCYVSQGDYIPATNNDINYDYLKTNVIDKIEYSSLGSDTTITTGDDQYLTLTYTFDKIITFNNYYLYIVVYYNNADWSNNYLEFEDDYLSFAYVNTNDNYAQGYSNGLTDGRQQGYDNGYQVGYNNGETAGNTQGYNEGFNNGKTQGYNEGVASVSSANSTIMGLFGAIANVPITILNSVMGPTLLGIPLVTILLNFLSVLLILWLIKKLIR